MSLRDGIANTVSASLSFALEGDPPPIVIGELQAWRVADAVLVLLRRRALAFWNESPTKCCDPSHLADAFVALGLDPMTDDEKDRLRRKVYARFYEAGR